MHTNFSNFDEFSQDFLSESAFTPKKLEFMREMELAIQRPKIFSITDNGMKQLSIIIDCMKQIAEESRSSFFVEYEPIPGLIVNTGDRNPVAVTGFFSRIWIGSNGVMEALQQIENISDSVVIRTAADDGMIIVLRDIGEEALVQCI